MHDEKTAYIISLYIHFHPGDVLDIATLSKKYGISKYTLERIFRKVFDQTVHQHITEVRLTSAYRLLAETDLPIKQIVVDVGYHSLPTFTRQFKERFHMTPARLRDGRFC